MTEKNFLSEELTESLRTVGYELCSFYQAFCLIKYCLESEVYEQSPAEIFCTMNILETHLQKIKKDFMQIQKRLGID